MGHWQSIPAVHRGMCKSTGKKLYDLPSNYSHAIWLESKIKEEEKDLKVEIRAQVLQLTDRSEVQDLITNGYHQLLQYHVLYLIPRLRQLLTLPFVLQEVLTGVRKSGRIKKKITCSFKIVFLIISNIHVSSSNQIICYHFLHRSYLLFFSSFLLLNYNQHETRTPSFLVHCCIFSAQNSI